jgi:hypothetical protein
MATYLQVIHPFLDLVLKACFRLGASLLLLASSLPDATEEPGLDGIVSFRVFKSDAVCEGQFGETACLARSGASLSFEPELFEQRTALRLHVRCLPFKELVRAKHPKED